MSNPPVAPQWQGWPTAPTWQAPRSPGATISLRLEAVVAVLVTTYCVILGAIMGLIWPRLAPHVQFIRAIDGSEAAAKALLGDDIWFALLGVVAGLVSVAILAVVGREAGRGPGGLIGLAVGGILGSLVAAHIGHDVHHLGQQPQIVAALKQLVPSITHQQINSATDLFDFKVRANAVLFAWPLTAVIMHAVLVILRYLRLGDEA